MSVTVYLHLADCPACPGKPIDEPGRKCLDCGAENEETPTCGASRCGDDGEVQDEDGNWWCKPCLRDIEDREERGHLWWLRGMR